MMAKDLGGGGPWCLQDHHSSEDAQGNPSPPSTSKHNVFIVGAAFKDLRAGGGERHSSDTVNGSSA